MIREVTEIDKSTLNEMMLNSAAPEDAVIYFHRFVSDTPDRIEALRGYAVSLSRAKRYDSAILAWQNVIGHSEANLDDKVELADAFLRAGMWSEAEKSISDIPTNHQNFKFFRTSALLADFRKDWKSADGFYRSAVGLNTTPSSTYNNWAYSNLSRGNFSEAERLLMLSLSYDQTSFTAKNNLVMARAGQKNYTLPPVEMDQIERAELLYTMALSALKQGDVMIGKELLREAIEGHPRHFEAAVRSLRALEG